MTDTSSWVLSAANAAPDLDPSDIAAVAANAQSKHEAIINAAAANGLGDAISTQKILEAQSPEIATKIWQKLPLDQQAVLVRSGYQPPQQKPQHHGGGGILGAIGGAVGAVEGALSSGYAPPNLLNVGKYVEHAKDLMHAEESVVPGMKTFHNVEGAVIDKVVHNPVADIAKEDVGGAFNLVATPVQKVTENLEHAYRAAGLLSDNERLDGDSWWQTYLDPKTYSPSQWAEQWQASANGKTTYSPVNEKHARQQYGDPIVDLVKQIQAGAKPADMLASIKDPVQQQLLAQLMGTDNYKDAFAYMDASHISIGRRAIPASLAVSNPELHSTLSGAIDGSWKIAMLLEADPMQLALDLPAEASSVKYTVKTGEDIRNAFARFEPVRTEFADVAAKLEELGPSGLEQAKPKWQGMGALLKDANVKSAEDVRDFISDGVGLRNFFEGQINGARAAERIVPHLTAFGERTQAIRLMGSKVIDWSELNDNPFISAPGTFLAKLTTALPRTTLINIGDPKPGDLQQVYLHARQFLSNEAATKAANIWYDMKNTQDRLKHLVSISGDMADALGLDRNSSNLVGRLFTEARDGMPGVRFSPTGADVMLTDTGTVAAALDTPQLANYVQLPGFREWLQAANKYHMLGAGGEGADTFVQAWRTATILRPAFALRAGGDELLLAMMRYGPTKMGRAMLATSAVKGGTPYTPLREMFEAITAHLPQELRDALTTDSAGINELVGAHMFDSTRRAMRGVAGKLAGEEYLNGARELAAMSPQARDAIANQISAAAHGVETYGPRLVDGYEVKKGGVWVPVQLAGTGKFKEYMAADPLFQLAAHMSMRQLSAGPLFSEAMRALADGKDDEAASAQVAAKIASPEFAGQRDRFLRNISDGEGNLAGHVDVPITHELIDGKPAAVQRLPLQHVDPTVEIRSGGRSLAGSSIEQNKIFLDRDAIENNYRLGMRYERGLVDTPGSRQKELVFTRMGADPAALQTWFDENGGVDAYKQFIVEHEKAHMQLGHTGTANEDLFKPESIQKETLANQLAFDRMGMPFGTPLQVHDQADLYRDWADRVVIHVRSQVTRQDGTLNTDLMARLIQGDVPDLDELGKMNPNDLMSSAIGPDYLPVHEGGVKPLVDKGFKAMVGRPMDWMVRQPMFLHNYVEARKSVEAAAIDLKLFKEKDGKITLDRQAVNDLAVKRAVSETIPYIHDVRQRSQFAGITRNLFPFWFAQEQAYRRFARTIQYAPGEFRKAMLLVHGLDHSGFVERDNSGQMMFHFPGHDLVQEALAPVLGTLFGKGAVSLPISTGFSGEIRALNPLTQHMGLPAASPLISIPSAVATRIFPELDSANTALTGTSQKKAIWQMLIPSHLSNLVTAWDDTNSQHLSAMNEGIAQLEANGLGLPDGAGPEQTQEYIDRLKKWSRGALFTRALFNLFAPAPSQLDVKNYGMNAEFKSLLDSGIPIGQAFNDFTKLHPNDNVAPWTVATTHSESSGFIPSTTKALDFIDANPEIAKKFPRALAWLVPQDPGPYDPRAHAEQLAYDMRTRQSPAEMLKAVKFAEAKTEYFARRDAKDAALLVAQHNPQQHAQIMNTWSQWENDYKAVHPLFADAIDNPKGQQRRTQVVNEMRGALYDDNVQESPTIVKMRQLIGAYDQLHQQLQTVQNHRDSRSTRLAASYNSVFLGWAKEFVVDDPNVDTFFHAIIEPDVKVKTNTTSGVNPYPVGVG